MPTDALDTASYFETLLQPEQSHQAAMEEDSMFSKILRRVAGLSACLAILTTIALAQTTQIEGTVKLKAEDGSLKPVPNAVIDIYRMDIKGKWDVKTDKAGHYVRLGMPVAGTFLLVVSGPGLEPTWVNGVRLLSGEPVDIIVRPGDGTRMTFEQVQAAINRAADSLGGRQGKDGTL
jgi:hypothetical protein